MTVHSFGATILCVLVTTLAQSLGEDRQWFSVNIYHLNSIQAAKLFDQTFDQAVLPSLKRQGIGPVGVFEPVHTGDDQNSKSKESLGKRYVIFPMESPSQLTALSESFSNDPEFLHKADAYLTVDKDQAIYSRIETSLLYAFEGMPRLALSAKSPGSSRLFELRVYESHSELKGTRKIEMFNQGEIALFKEVGLDAVFFGQALAGANLPNLTYMLVYNDETHRKEVWGKFLSSPKWEQMKGNPRYNGTVSKIISRHMVPLPYSAIQ